MSATDLNINLSLRFNQLLELIEQLSYKDKVRLTKVLLKETSSEPEIDEILTHYASEDTLAKDWLLNEEEEAWKDL